MLVGAGFFGYMLALLQRRLCTIVASQDVSALVLSYSFSCITLNDTHVDFLVILKWSITYAIYLINRKKMEGEEMEEKRNR